MNSEDEETILKLKSHEFSAMWEVMVDIMLKVSGTLYENEENFRKVFSPYLLCRFLSMRENLVGYANLLSSIASNSRLTNEQFYRLAYRLIPKQKSAHIRYLKKQAKGKADGAKAEEVNSPNEKLSLFDL